MEIFRRLSLADKLRAHRPACELSQRHRLGDERRRRRVLATLTADIAQQVKNYGAIKDVPAAATSNVRNDMYLASDALRVMGTKPSGFNDGDVAKLKSLRSSLDSGTKKVSVALALGLGTMVGWKRIVMTVGEKIGKTHLTYARGASAESSRWRALAWPMSTGCLCPRRMCCRAAWPAQWRLAWVLTLPAAMVIAGALYVILRQIF